MTAPTRQSQAQTKKCPYCAEVIRLEAVKCRFCGSDLTAVVRTRRLRRWITPILGGISVVLAAAGGLAEVLALAGVNQSTPSAPPRPVGGGPQTGEGEDGVHIALLVSAILIGSAGLLGALLRRRRRSLATAIFAAAGIAAFAVTIATEINVFVVALGAVLLAAAALTGFSVAQASIAPGRTTTLSRLRVLRRLRRHA